MNSTLVWEVINIRINAGCKDAFAKLQTELPEQFSPADALLFQLAWKEAVNWTLKNMQKELERS